MATLKELRNEKLRKLADIKQLGINPYPATSKRTHMARQLVEGFEQHQGQTVTVAGRVVGVRKFGKIAFFVLKDASGEVQLFLKPDNFAAANPANSELGFEHINLLDPGDFIETSGLVIKTQTGEVSVEVTKLRLLAKALRSLPTKQEGFSNKEERLRRRYVDTNVNQDVYERFIRRSKFWQATRDFLNHEGFVEINTPVLEHTTGGADANPFVTHMDALDQDFYLRISHELPLKRLIGGGYEKVYDIGPRFRNENYSDEHLPEHIAFESYAAYQDYEDGMELYERMMKDVAQATWGTLQFKIGEFEVNLDQKWPVVKYADIMYQKFDVDVFEPNFEQLKTILKENKVELDGDVNINRAMDSVWKIIRKTSAGPFWLIHEPVEISPLAKQDPADPRVTQRFHPVIGGTEMGNGYSELNDPIDQLHRFLDQQAMRDAGDAEAQMLDIDFVEMLEYGMPPACGWSYSERFFWAFEGVSAREGVVFPQLRKEVDETTQKIYPEVVQVHNLTTRRPNTLPPTSDKMSEENRMAYQLAVILNKNVETGRAINAATHAVSGFIGTLNKPEQLNYLEYHDKTGELDVVISHHPTIILQASDSKELLKAYRKARAEHVPANAFIETMTIGSSQEELAILKTKTIDELDFWGVVLFGKTEDVQKVTKNFQLWK